VRAPRRCWVAMAAMLASAAQASFAGGEPVVTLDDSGATALVVRTFDAPQFTTQRYAYALAGKLRAQTIRLRSMTETGAPVAAVVVASGERSLQHIPDSSFAAGAAAAAPVQIGVSNDADAFDIACDDRTAVVVGANSATPVALVDLVAQAETATIGYTGKLGRSVAVSEDGTQALVVLDDQGVSAAGVIRRVLISPGGLADAGEFLAFGASYISRVHYAPGGKFGVAVVGGSGSELVSFTVPGLVRTSSVSLAGGVGNAVVFNAAGDRVYVRSGRRDVKDAVEAFTFDAATGQIGQTALWRSDAIAGFNGVVYQTPMAITEDGRYLIAGDEDVGGHSPAPHLTSIDAVTGSVTDYAALSTGAKPFIVATKRRCKSVVPVQTAVEYRHATFGHYFATSIADEIAKLDSGTFPGWSRTGKQFNVYPSGTAGTTPTCRFFSTAFGAKSSHFYATSGGECATVKSNPSWLFEGEVFATSSPAADGTCPSSAAPLYRLYNNGLGGAPNHRYTTDPAVRTQMMSEGWVPEGAGPGVVACVPP
jgi:hypothetical protein